MLNAIANFLTSGNLTWLNERCIKEYDERAAVEKELHQSKRQAKRQSAALYDAKLRFDEYDKQLAERLELLDKTDKARVDAEKWSNLRYDEAKELRESLSYARVIMSHMDRILAWHSPNRDEETGRFIPRSNDDPLLDGLVYDPAQYPGLARWIKSHPTVAGLAFAVPLPDAPQPKESRHPSIWSDVISGLPGPVLPNDQIQGHH